MYLLDSCPESNRNNIPIQLPKRSIASLARYVSDESQRTANYEQNHSTNTFDLYCDKLEETCPAQIQGQRISLNHDIYSQRYQNSKESHFRSMNKRGPPNDVPERSFYDHSEQVSHMIPIEKSTDQPFVEQYKEYLELFDAYEQQFGRIDEPVNLIPRANEHDPLPSNMNEKLIPEAADSIFEDFSYDCIDVPTFMSSGEELPTNGLDDHEAIVIDTSSYLSTQYSPSAPPINNDFRSCDSVAKPTITANGKSKSSKPMLPPIIRPLNAYNFFFTAEREKILSSTSSSSVCEDDNNDCNEARKILLLVKHLAKDRSKTRKHRKTHGKIDFKTLSREISQRWKRLPQEQKKFYQDVAATDLMRYKEELKMRVEDEGKEFI